VRIVARPPLSTAVATARCILRPHLYKHKQLSFHDKIHSPDSCGTPGAALPDGLCIPIPSVPGSRWFRVPTLRGLAAPRSAAAWEMRGMDSEGRCGFADRPSLPKCGT